MGGERSKLERLELALGESQREHGRAQGRAQELEARLEQMDRSHARALQACDGRLRDHEQQASADVERLTREVAQIQGAASELRLLIPPVEDDERRIVRVRARACLGAAAICGVLSLILLPAVLVSLFSGQRPEYLRLAIGMPAGVMLLSEVALLAGAYVLSTQALRGLRNLKNDAEPSGA